MDRRIKLRHIDAFVEIVRQRSMKRAAERLNLTQPAISRTLAELERITGSRLLTRSRSGVALTREGEVLFDFALVGLGALKRGLSELAEQGARGAPALRIGALPSVAARVLPEATALLCAQAPELRLTIADGAHGHLTELLRAGELDLVLGRLGAPTSMRGLSFQQLYLEDVALVVRPGHPILAAPALERLQEEFPVIFPPPWAAIRPFVDRMLLAEGLNAPTRRIETVSGAFGRVYAARSDAVWIISAGVVADEIADGRLVRLPLAAQGSEGPVGLMRRADQRETPEQRLFAHCLGDALQRLELA